MSRWPSVATGVFSSVVRPRGLETIGRTITHSTSRCPPTTITCASPLRRGQRRRTSVSDRGRGGGGGRNRDHASTRDAVRSTKEAPPSARDLRLVFVNEGLPFVGFGIMDNAILIVAGDAIDHSLGAALGISTLCAAALGNIVSDVAGVGLGGVVEDLCARLGLPAPRLTDAQRASSVVRATRRAGVAVGLTVGCLIGMFPLLFLDHHDDDRKKEEERTRRDARRDVRDGAVARLVGAERATLILIVERTDESTSTDEDDDDVDDALRDVARRVALSGDAEIVDDLKTNDAVAVRNAVCVPVKNAEGEVVGVLGAVNKTSDDERASLVERPRTRSFTSTDVRTLRMLASHVSVALRTTTEDDEDGGERPTGRARVRDCVRSMTANESMR